MNLGHRAAVIGFLSLLMAIGLILQPGTTDMTNERFVAFDRQPLSDSSLLTSLAHVPANGESPTVPLARAGDAFRLSNRPTPRSGARDLPDRFLPITPLTTVGDLSAFIEDVTGEPSRAAGRNARGDKGERANAGDRGIGYRLFLGNDTFARSGVALAVVHPHNPKWPLAIAFVSLDVALIASALAWGVGLAATHRREARGLVLFAAAVMAPTIVLMAKSRG